eukprot:TRINITY_DN179_c0_g1_i1.p1 TRINITY_DN179_c0_g1~~TRINITY_DN179_c0_g1_i1.p1  ORF type:complete len:276 (-),score=107.99 TRINITY_DN179_c0_g1_i1:141-968(-)
MEGVLSKDRMRMNRCLEELEEKRLEFETRSNELKRLRDEVYALRFSEPTVCDETKEILKKKLEELRDVEYRWSCLFETQMESFLSSLDLQGINMKRTSSFAIPGVASSDSISTPTSGVRSPRESLTPTPPPGPLRLREKAPLARWKSVSRIIRTVNIWKKLTKERPVDEKEGNRSMQFLKVFDPEAPKLKEEITSIRAKLRILSFEKRLSESQQTEKMALLQRLRECDELLRQKAHKAIDPDCDGTSPTPLSPTAADVSLASSGSTDEGEEKEDK